VLEPAAPVVAPPPVPVVPVVAPVVAVLDVVLAALVDVPPVVAPPAPDGRVGFSSEKHPASAIEAKSSSVIEPSLLRWRSMRKFPPDE
jgi:hypothetical protein